MYVFRTHPSRELRPVPHQTNHRNIDLTPNHKDPDTDLPCSGKQTNNKIEDVDAPRQLARNDQLTPGSKPTSLLNGTGNTTEMAN